MRFIPKKTKFKKYQKGRLPNKISNTFGLFEKYRNLRLRCFEHGLLTSIQIESMRQLLRKYVKRKGFFSIPLIADLPVTKKPLEVRMGKGKGAVNSWVCKVRPGSILCNMKIKNKSLGIKALSSTQFRLPIKTKLFNN